MWLDKAQGCVDPNIAFAHARLLEEEADLSSCSVRGIRTMACVSGAVSPELGPQGLGRLRSGFVGVGGPNERAPAGNCTCMEGIKMKWLGHNHTIFVAGELQVDAGSQSRETNHFNTALYVYKQAANL